MAKIDFDVNPIAGDLDPRPNNIELRGGDFVSFRPPATGEKVRVKLIGTKVNVLVAPKFPPLQTFKFLQSPVLEGGDVVVRFRSLKTSKKKLPPAARKKKITFTIAVKGQNVKIRPKMDKTEIRSGALVVFRLPAAIKKSVFVELGSPQVYFGIARSPTVSLGSVFSPGMVQIGFTNQGGGPSDTKPYP